ncbi:hypothetical protein BDZ94DRAFT_1241838 [Collybia nuda]|uniref:Ribonuclease H1 N-terminal domain-containing protein n=1 Tax=Collybia nuda TaxID=64659 RepID=A0A9P6CBH2_9AGAR|nr:hypothetical protein BDZ94DRAFT_1241838 [Collybia nuda]
MSSTYSGNCPCVDLDGKDLYEFMFDELSGLCQEFRPFSRSANCRITSVSSQPESSQPVPVPAEAAVTETPSSPPPTYTLAARDGETIRQDPSSPTAVTEKLAGIHSSQWYVVTVGREPGIYTSWPSASPEVLGVKGFKIYSPVQAYNQRFSISTERVQPLHD